MIIHFSALKGKSIVDVENQFVSKLEDVVIIDGEKFAEVTAIVYRANGDKVKLPWKLVDSLNKYVYLHIKKSALQPEKINQNDILLSEHILDKQLIDVDGLKVIRVNDIIMAKVYDKFSVVSVDAGIKGFARRLGIDIPFVKGNPNIIPWEFVEPLQTDKNLKLKVSRQKIAKLHPADIADLLEELSPKERATVIGSLDDQTAARTLVESEPNIRKSVFDNIKTLRIAAVLEKMSFDEAADLLSLMPDERANEILKLTSPEFSAKIAEVLGYSAGSAGRIMTPEFIAVPEDYTAELTINTLRELMPKAEHAYYIYIVNKESKLIGVLSMRELVTSKPDRKVTEFMNNRVIKVLDKDPKEEAAKLIVKYNLMVLPVVDQFDHLIGIITMDDVLANVVPRSWRKISYKKIRKRRKSKSAAK